MKIKEEIVLRVGWILVAVLLFILAALVTEPGGGSSKDGKKFCKNCGKPSVYQAGFCKSCWNDFLVWQDKEYNK